MPTPPIILSSTTVASVSTYLTPTLHITPGIPVAMVWGESDQKSPYGRNNYHAGHLSMVCAAMGLIALGAKVTIFLTSDHQARVNQGVYGPFYERRQRELMDWLQRTAGGVDILPVLDVPTEYDKIPITDASRKDWIGAGELFARICKDVEAAQLQLSNGERSALETWFGGLREARVQDEQADWDRFFTETPPPDQVKGAFDRLFSEVTYTERNADIAATAYVISRVVNSNIKKWRPDDIRNWISECGSVLCRNVTNGMLVESARNMYWLRCLRLLSQTIAIRESHPIPLPKLCRYRNLSDLNGHGAMMSINRDTCVPIFAPPDKIQHALSECASSWLSDFATRLTWTGGRHSIARDLTTVLESGGFDNALRNATLETICDLTDMSGHSLSDSVRVDDWFCVKFLTDSFLKMPNQQRWKDNITAAHLLHKGSEDSCYPKLAEAILDNIDSRLREPNECLFSQAVRKTVDWTDSIDLLLHMVPKRYRDHGRHQLNVAAVADLLWTASAPTDDYTNAVTVAEATAKTVATWQDQHRLLRDISMLAVLAHDHGYALQHVAWVLGRLQSMKLKGTNPEVITKTEALAEAFLAYVQPFASKWFLTEICDRIKNDEESPSRCIASNGWTYGSTGKLDLIVPNHPNRSKWPGHGTFGAMNLWGLMEEISGKSIQLAPGCRILQALHAIAVHDDVKVPVSINTNPLSYMLAISDEIQEWNRRLFHEGEPYVESQYCELDGNGVASKFGLQLHRDELRVRFFHLGIEKTRAPWDYKHFREGKQENWKRADSDGSLFPKKITFETVVGP